MFSIFVVMHFVHSPLTETMAASWTLFSIYAYASLTLLYFPPETLTLVSNSELDTDGIPLAHLMVPHTFAKRTRQTILEVNSQELGDNHLLISWQISLKT